MTEPKQYGPFTEADLIDPKIEQRVAWAKSQFSTWKPIVRYDNLRFCTIEEEISWELCRKAREAEENLPEYKYMREVEDIIEHSKELPPEHKEFVEAAAAYYEAKCKLIENHRWLYYRDKLGVTS